MHCEEFLNQLNARNDGELSAEAEAGLNAHLAACWQCREAAEGLRTIDVELRCAFVPRREAAERMAKRAVAMVRASSDIPVSRALPAPPAARPAWGQILLATAAGFLLAVALLRPWQSKTLVPARSAAFEPIARLAVASAPVEVRAASQIPAFTCQPATPIQRDSVIRTGPTAQCEIALAGGNALRLDRNTEVTLRRPKVVEVKQGRLWSRIQPGPSGLEFPTAGCTIVAKQAAEVALECQPPAVRLIVIGGAVNVEAGSESVEVGAGKQVRIVRGKVEADPQPRDALLETAWVNGVLALRGSKNPELVERVDRLLANVGAAKLSLLYEDELRRLGDSAVPPLLAYLESTRATPNTPQRATAARIVADVAQPRWIADLIALLTDAGADVRFHAARGLERLTGRNQGIQPVAWQSQPWASCESAYEKWRKWWDANRDQYASTREVPQPASAPF